MAWLLVKDGIIVNNVEYDGESHFIPEEGHSLVQTEDPHDIGWEWDGEKAVEPTPSTPEPASTPQPTLSELQAQLATLTAHIQALANTGN